MAGYVAPVVKLTRVSDGFEFNVPSDMKWSERNKTANVVQNVEHTIGGSAVIESGLMLGGIPFTLESRAGVWMTKLDFDALLAEARLDPAEEYTLVLPSGETKKLCWRYSPAAVEGEELRESRTSVEAIYINVKLNFFEEA